MKSTEPLARAMIRWFDRDGARVHHLLKVWAFARIIGQGEGLEQEAQFVLESAALAHDIGIKTAEARYGCCSAPLQEELGPQDARPMLEKLGYTREERERICWLIGHHHTYGLEAGIDYQILLEADFLVNAYEAPFAPEAIAAAGNGVFRTRSGRELLRTLYPDAVCEKEKG